MHSQKEALISSHQPCGTAGLMTGNQCFLLWMHPRCQYVYLHCSTFSQHQCYQSLSPAMGSGKPIGVDTPWTFAVSFLYTDRRRGWGWKCYRFTFIETWPWMLLLPTLNERKETSLSFRKFCFPRTGVHQYNAAKKSGEKTNQPIRKQK